MIHPAAINPIRRARLARGLGLIGDESLSSGTAAPLSPCAGGEATARSGPRGVCGVVEAVTEATYRRYHFCAEFLANAGNKDFNRVGITIKVLIIDMFDELGAACL